MSQSFETKILLSLPIHAPRLLRIVDLKITQWSLNYDIVFLSSFAESTENYLISKL